ncbi:hypothetical protein [Aeromonas caviae]|uniref:hypothetical protein n=1 Tax=Aeromonas caviae TaxID=648 RepID=UPI002B4A1972|nr:hypothetical protein [Aeromonas caviae]
MRLPDGVTGGQSLEVAPKSQPMSEAGLIALAKQRRREAEEMEAILARREQAEQERQEEARRVAEAQAKAEQEKRERVEQEARKWAEINARPVPSGQLNPAGVHGFDRTVIDAAPSLPMLVGDDLVITSPGLTLEVFELVSPIVPRDSSALLVALYQDEADRRWWELVEKARALLGKSPWLYTAAMPAVSVEDAGPADQHGTPSGSHKVIRAIWGDSYIHNPIREGE